MKRLAMVLAVVGFGVLARGQESKTLQTWVDESKTKYKGDVHLLIQAAEGVIDPLPVATNAVAPVPRRALDAFERGNARDLVTAAKLTVEELAVPTTCETKIVAYIDGLGQKDRTLALSKAFAFWSRYEEFSRGTFLLESDTVEATQPAKVTYQSPREKYGWNKVDASQIEQCLKKQDAIAPHADSQVEVVR